jgi:hypothetical protein
MAVNVSKSMEEPAGLGADRFHHPRMAMAHGRHPEAGGEIYIKIAVDIPDVRPFGLVPEEGGGIWG